MLNETPHYVWCEHCGKCVKIEDCVEVESGQLVHESLTGYIHVIR